MILKRAKVVMLPTKEKAVIQKFGNQLRLNQFKADNLAYWQNIYIISDDEINKNDWFINLLNNKIEKATNWIYVSTCKKIIATTDKSLFNEKDCPVRGGDSKVRYILPQPSESFIQKFIEAYNKGEVITDVLVEHEKTMCSVPFESTKCRCVRNEECHNPVEKLKINSKNNTLTIRKQKDSWSREELQPLKDYYEHSKLFAKSNDYREQDVQRIFDWIEENL